MGTPNDPVLKEAAFKEKARQSGLGSIQGKTLI
jgi:hypothetical protein